MVTYETFAECLQRVLKEQGMSASEAARLVGFRSRNSLFRILNGTTGVEVDAHFLTALHQAVGEAWPAEQWRALETALEIRRIGLEQYLSDQAFCHGIYGVEQEERYLVETHENGDLFEKQLEEHLREICREGKITVVIGGCCERGLTSVLARCFSAAGAEGRLTVRQYIDRSERRMVHRIMGTFPLMSKVWYNARLVDEQNCPEEMAAIYRLNVICLAVEQPDGQTVFRQMLQCDHDRFVEIWGNAGQSRLVNVLDRHRFQMDLLKPMSALGDGYEAFVQYTEQYAQLENDCMILSVKPDLHFNLVPSEILYPAIFDGFEQAGMASGEELNMLLQNLKDIHDGRVKNMYGKKRPTHIVYSLQAMEQFMRTGVQSDHFFLQRAYTPEERREIVRLLLRQAEEDPYFNVYFLREDLPEIRCEMTLYEGKGVLMMDAYTSYDLMDDHSEALITMPGFQQSFQKFFLEFLLQRLVMSRQESLMHLEWLILLSEQSK